MKIRKKGVIVVIIIALLFICTNKAEAALQSNGATATGYNLGDWILKIRQMQSNGGTLGLSDNINTTYLTSDNQNLDIHMQKNTEYGALAILSASAYGNSNKIEDEGTTTGNSTGVVMRINKNEGVVGTRDNFEGYSWQNIRNIKGRYRNIYNDLANTRKGDAGIETAQWHGATTTTRYNNASTDVIVRSNPYSIFSYKVEGNSSSAPTYTRAVIVVGTGI